MRILFCILVSSLSLFYDLTGESGKRKEEIIIRTEYGDIFTHLNLRKAPLTSNNFLRYIDADLFDSACFYRIVRLDNQPDNAVKIEVIQGGRYKNEENGFSPVVHETTKITGLRHKNGTISMARSEPGSATSEFFICIGDQPELDYGGRRNPDGQGFAAFGKVKKGMHVVKRIHSIKSSGQYLDKPLLIIEIKRNRK